MTATRFRPGRRGTVLLGAVAAGTLLLASPVAAHVSVTPDSAPAGSAAELTFHVPNEEATADTSQVDVQIPVDHPIAQLLVKPVPGWTATVKTVKLAKPIVTDDGSFNQAVSEVIWSGGRISPGQYQDFSVSADPLPDNVDQLVFKALQTYTNGDVVRWIDVTQPGQPAPDHPAPVLTLTKGTPATQTGARVSAPAASAAATGSDGLARSLGIAGLVAAIAALALAGLQAWRRRDGG